MGIFVKKIIRNKGTENEREAGEELRYGRIIGTVATIVIVVMLLTMSIVVVKAGHVGVLDLFGDVDESEMHPGLHFKNPFASVKQMTTQTQEYTMSYTRGEGAKVESDIIEALTKEGLTVGLDITVLFSLEPDEASVIYKTIKGADYKKVIVRPQVRTVIREVIARYDAKQIYSEDRTTISQEIFDALKPVLDERGILLEKVLLRHVQLPTQLTKAIENKLTAEQTIEQRQFEVQVEKQEAERKRVEARGIADAQTIIDETLTPEYLKYLLIIHLKDYTGGKIFIPMDLNMNFVYDINE